MKKISIPFLVVAIIQVNSCSEKSNNNNSKDLLSRFDSVYFQNPADSTTSYPEHWPDQFGLGRIVSEKEINRWDIDVMPDGNGLPIGQGTVSEGNVIYKNKCAVCHGISGVEGPFDRLAGREPRDGFPFGKDVKYLPMRTIGNYWPYATTLFDYIRRAMPQTEPGSLTDNEVYALTAYLLHLNEIIPEDAVMDNKTLSQIVMPARDRFVVDNRRGGNEIR